MTAGENWTREEVEATGADCFAMLHAELAGLPTNKAGHNAKLRTLLDGRSKGSVEFKHANISAVLTVHGYPYIDGYKPRSNYQALLEQVVLESSSNPPLQSLQLRAGSAPIHATRLVVGDVSS